MPDCPCKGTGINRRTCWIPTGNKTPEGKVERKPIIEEVPCGICREADRQAYWKAQDKIPSPNKPAPGE